MTNTVGMDVYTDHRNMFYSLFHVSFPCVDAFVNVDDFYLASDVLWAGGIQVAIQVLIETKAHRYFVTMDIRKSALRSLCH